MSSNSAVNASMLKLAGAAEGDVSHAKAKTPASLKDEAASQIEELSELAGVADGEVSQEKAKTPASLEDQPASQTEEPLELTGATDGKASQAKDETFVSPRDESARRIEKLLEHQNELMLRQIRLAEDNRKHADSMQGILLQNPRTILKALDPSVQGIFKEWHAEFRSKVDVYVKQSQLLNQYQVSAARDGHIAPFSDEASISGSGQRHTSPMPCPSERTQWNKVVCTTSEQLLEPCARSTPKRPRPLSCRIRRLA